jgi:hypothetical protein
MAYKNNERGKSLIKNKISFLLLFLAGCLLLAPGAFGQTTETTSTTAPANAPVTLGGYELTSSVEVGVRGVSVNGNDNKYRSDFNYRPGLRVFDSSFLLENKDGKSRFIDSLLVTSSGWNSDPSGFTRISVERVGFYRFDSKIRQVSYFNNLNNHARNGHTADTRHNFGDFDLTLYPLSDKLKIRLGAGFNKTTGSGSITSRAYSDEFPITSNVDTGATDLRAGLDTELLGFNLSMTYGFRRFDDDTSYTTQGNFGYNTTNTTVIATFDRKYPIKGSTQFAMFNAQRTFAKKLDFTARVVYSGTDRTFGFTEQITGRDNSNNIVDLDRFNITGDSKRLQTRADLGATWMVTDNFRISETFTFDQFNISGGTAFAEALYTRTAAGGPRNPVFTNTLYHRVTGFRRFLNTIEADYQFSNRFGVNVGYRYSQRRIDLLGFNQTLPPATTPTRSLIEEEEENNAHSVIAGFKAKPIKNWTIYGDLEYGDADNAFTRLANYNYTNLRLRSRWSFKDFAINVSAISKDNENPSTSTAAQGGVVGDFIANTKSRTFSAYVDWTPASRFAVSGGYTFQRLTSETDIVINTGTLVRGRSEYYMRDHYAFFDVTARPFRRVSLYAGYHHNEDLGQGDRFSPLPQILISSYPFKLFTMESRVAVRLTRNIDWNVGYQYIGYNERIQPLSVGGPQDYHANLPYTSLRIFFGGGER